MAIILSRDFYAHVSVFTMQILGTDVHFSLVFSDSVSDMVT